MAIKDIIDTAVDVGKTAVTRGKEVAERRLRGDKTPSGAPSTVGAARPGEPGGPKSATATERAQEATAPARAAKSKPTAKAKAKPAKAKAKPAKAKAKASKAAASSAKEVSDAARDA